MNYDDVARVVVATRYQQNSCRLHIHSPSMQVAGCDSATVWYSDLDLKWYNYAFGVSGELFVINI